MTHTRPKPRARDLGLPLGGVTGPLNAITDIAGLHVGHRTIIEHAPRAGRPMPLRSGVTAIIPHAASPEPVPVYAGLHRFNGNGELTGSHWIEDGGYFLGPVLITNTHSVGAAHAGAIRWMLTRHAATYGRGDDLWIMPVVGETYDGVLSDINGQHITPEDAIAALDAAHGGAVTEGNTGGGTGMIAYGFKGGTGTSSRVVEVGGRRFTIGALVQANHGAPEWLTVCGVPVGRELHGLDAPGPASTERGSIIVVIATDLPMAPHQLKKLARRGAIGIGRGGTPGGNSSGDIFLAFSTANPRPMPHMAPLFLEIEMINDEGLDAVYLAAVECVEEAVLNAMCAAEDMGGTEWDRGLVRALPTAQLCEILRRHGRLVVR
ncbi:MAG: P1 family peptidase [Hyphomicrobium sp.]|nr:P1 family peptidase [Hyphomicrobium sp.]